MSSGRDCVCRCPNNLYSGALHVVSGKAGVGPIEELYFWNCSAKSGSLLMKIPTESLRRRSLVPILLFDGRPSQRIELHLGRRRSERRIERKKDVNVNVKNVVLRPMFRTS